MVLAAIVFPPLLCLAQNHLGAALGTGNADFFQIRLCIPAVGKSGAGKETSVGAVFDDHIAAAEITDHVRGCFMDISGARSVW